ncbi:ribonuclease H-like domain-containing protein [Tanacetum coccineum]
MVSATKLPVLNPGEFELWKMMIEQYFLMTDYALWEVIVNGDSPPPKRTVDGVEQTYPPTNVEETLMEAIEKRFRGNKESKKTQKTLLKQQYENFNRSSSEGLDQTYDRLQKLISHLEILGETISQEDMNLNSNQAYDSNSVNTDSMSDVVIYSFFANQSNSLQLNDEGLQQINADDLEEMDLKWQLAMLTMRAKRFLNKTGKKSNANGSETIGYNKSKVKCYNCHKKGHFTRECRAPRENRNREPVRRNVTVETTKTKALVAQDGLGCDWSDQAEEGPTNFALMAYTSSGSSSSSSSDFDVSTCSKACLKSYETLKEHYDNLIKDFNKSQLSLGAYKAELRKKFKKAEKERDDLKLTLEKFGNSSKNLSKLLEIQVSDKFKTGVGFDSQVVDSQVFDSQENDRYKTSEGYHAVSPPYTRNFMPPKSDLVLADEEEYVFSKSITSEVKTSESKTKSVSEPLIED